MAFPAKLQTSDVTVFSPIDHVLQNCSVVLQNCRTIEITQRFKTDTYRS